MQGWLLLAGVRISHSHFTHSFEPIIPQHELDSLLRMHHAFLPLHDLAPVDLPRLRLVVVVQERVQVLVEDLVDLAELVADAGLGLKLAG